MKTKLVGFIAAMFCSIFIMAQCTMPINESGAYELKEVVKNDSTATKSQLFNAAMISFAEIFKDSEQVIEYSNAEEGVIMGNFVIIKKSTGIAPATHTFKFSLRLDFKDSRYRAKVNHLDHTRRIKHLSCGCSNILLEKCGGMCTGKKEWGQYALSSQC